MGYNAQRAAAQKKRPRSKPGTQARGKPATPPQRFEDTAAFAAFQRPLGELHAHLTNIEQLDPATAAESLEKAAALLPHLESAARCIQQLRELRDNYDPLAVIPPPDLSHLVGTERSMRYLIAKFRRIVEGRAVPVRGASDDTTRIVEVDE
ncbi:hypothetical protein H9P43_006788 [Blastocladiella emersonii ATCC 22665]|nr:hypothetical protein H9P43_006788 [Blastocladiella emersonii ATCC 22665]